MNEEKLYYSIETLIEQFNSLYGEISDFQKERYQKAFSAFKELFDKDCGYFVSSPGRIEICGNHTDHNGGMVMCSAISLDSLAVFLPIEENKAIIFSEGYGKIEVDFDKEFTGKKGTSSAIVYGVKEGLKSYGYKVGGFIAYVTSNVLGGAGISSSASFELLVAEILNFLYNEERVTKAEKALIAQFSEREYFGKPCGLLDQTAISYGGLNKLDFSVKGEIGVEKIENNLEDYTLILINTGGSHENLTDEYAAVPREMFEVANTFGKERLIDLDEQIFYANKNELKVSARAKDRAEHFYEENKRVLSAYNALKNNDYKTFIKAINESGKSSLTKLKNCYVESFKERPIVDALSRAETCIGEGACRVHGGGFAGTTLNIVKNQDVPSFISGMRKFYSQEDIILLKVRSNGTIVL